MLGTDSLHHDPVLVADDLTRQRSMAQRATSRRIFEMLDHDIILQETASLEHINYVNPRRCIGGPQQINQSTDRPSGIDKTSAFF